MKKPSLKSKSLKKIPCLILAAACVAGTVHWAHADDALNSQLLSAIQKGDLQQVSQLVEKGADVNATATLSTCETPEGQLVPCQARTIPLMVASGEGQVAIAQYLVSKGADPSVLIPEGMFFTSPIDKAVNYQFKHLGDDAQEAADLKITQGLMDAYIPAAAQSVIRENKVDQLYMDRSESLLALASEFGELDAAKKLISAGADVNLKSVIANDRGLPPLMEAAFGKQPALVSLLLDHGADVNLRMRNGNSAIGYSAYEADPRCARILLDRGANPNLFDGDGDSPLDQAVISDKLFAGQDLSNRIQVIQLLVSHHADINAQSPDDGKTALMASIWAPHPEIVEALLDSGANPNLKNKDGQTALSIANDYLNDPQLGTSPQQKPLYQKVIDELKAHGETQ